MLSNRSFCLVRQQQAQGKAERTIPLPPLLPRRRSFLIITNSDSKIAILNDHCHHRHDLSHHPSPSPALASKSPRSAAALRLVKLKRPTARVEITEAERRVTTPGRKYYDEARPGRLRVPGRRQIELPISDSQSGCAHPRGDWSPIVPELPAPDLYSPDLLICGQLGKHAAI
eukprot:756198-Hanusia_phi.AAC.1